MDAAAPVPNDHPLMIAWKAYQSSGEYQNTKNWAAFEEHVDGSLWAAFVEGWEAGSNKGKLQSALEASQREAEELRKVNSAALAVIKAANAYTDSAGEDDYKALINALAIHAKANNPKQPRQVCDCDNKEARLCGNSIGKDYDEACGCTCHV